MKIVIIGGIAAGTSAAAKLRRLKKDAEVKIYEIEPYVSFGACGLPYYVGGHFNDPDNMIARTPEKHREAGINICEMQEVLSVDPKNKKLTVKNLKDGSIYEDNYDKLMIATGANAIMPPIKNIDLGNVYTLKTLHDGEHIKAKLNDPSIKNVTIIGAGFIGLEVAEACHKLNKNVSVFQLEDRVLKEVFDKEVTDILEETLRNHGVNLYLSSTVKELQGEGSVSRVITDEHNIEADLVIVAAGFKPNTDFVKDTGIEMLKNGAIVVNNYGESSIQDIFSAGDCATVPHLLKKEAAYVPLATVANKFGRIVGENLAEKNSKFEGTLASSCIKVIDMDAARTGLSEEEAKREGYEVKTVFVTDKTYTNYYPGREDIHAKLIYEAGTNILLGGQLVGKKDVVHRVDALAIAIRNKMTTQELGMMDFCYSPPFSRTWEFLNIAGNAAK